MIMAQWLPLLTSQSDVDATLESMQQAGVKVLRTWVKPQIVSFGEGYTDEPQGIQCYQRDGIAECAGNESDLLPGMCFVMVTILSWSSISVQVWNSSQWVLNDGPQGLQRLDNVIKSAEKHDIKVIVAFTNNWFVGSHKSTDLN